MKKNWYLICAFFVLAVAVAVYLRFAGKEPSVDQGPPAAVQPSAVSTPAAGVSGVSAPGSESTAPSAEPSPETVKLLKELQDPKASDAEKIRIMLALGKQQESQAFPVLLALFDEGPQKLRLETALALARFEDPDLRLQALNRIDGRCQDPRLKSGLEVLRNAERHIDLPELKTLAAHSSDPLVFQLLALYVYDENRDVRLAVIEWLPPRHDLTKRIFLHLLREEEYQKSDDLRLALFFALEPWKEDKEVVRCITENFDKEHQPEWM